MKLLAEEETVNNVINQLQADFVLKPDLKITVEPGSSLNESTFEPALKDTLTMLKQKVGTVINQKSYQLVDEQLYVIGFEETDEGNLIRFIVPYGVNIANVLSNTIIDHPKDSSWTPQKIHQTLQNLFEETIVHIVTQELFKYYMPDNQKVPKVPKSILDQIKYTGLKNDDFNLVMTFVLPVKDLYPPLKKAIETKAKDTNYDQSSLTPLHSIVYNDKDNTVKLVTSLN